MDINEIIDAINELDTTDVEIVDTILDQLPNSLIATYFNRYTVDIIREEKKSK